MRRSRSSIGRSNPLRPETDILRSWGGCMARARLWEWSRKCSPLASTPIAADATTSASRWSDKSRDGCGRPSVFPKRLPDSLSRGRRSPTSSHWLWRVIICSAMKCAVLAPFHDLAARLRLGRRPRLHRSGDGTGRPRLRKLAARPLPHRRRGADGSLAGDDCAGPAQRRDALSAGRHSGLGQPWRGRPTCRTCRSGEGRRTLVPCRRGFWSSCRLLPALCAVDRWNRARRIRSRSISTNGARSLIRPASSSCETGKRSGAPSQAPTAI